MSHRLTATDTMFSRGATPWHGLGTVVADAPSISDAIKLAGLDWAVEAQPNYTMVDGVMTPTPSQSIIRVDHDGKRSVVASVGPGYAPLQNDKAFAWFAPWLDSGKLTLETAGSLEGGRKVWILAKISGGPIKVKGDDVVEKFVLLAHAHDGTLAVRAGLTPIRVVCWNTLSAAIGANAQGKVAREVDGIFRLRHAGDVAASLDAIKGSIEQLDARLDSAGEAYRELASHNVPDEAALVAFMGAVYKQNPQTFREGRRWPKLQELFEGGVGQDLPGAKGTWWGAYNAITESVTHHAGRSVESRAKSSAFAEGAGIVARALEIGLDFARGARTWDVDEVFGVGSAASTLATSEHPHALTLVR